MQDQASASAALENRIKTSPSTPSASSSAATTPSASSSAASAATTTSATTTSAEAASAPEACPPPIGGRLSESARLIATEGTIATTLRTRSTAKAPHLVTGATLRSKSVIGHPRRRLYRSIRCANRLVLGAVSIRISQAGIPGNFARLGKCRLRYIRIIGSILLGSSTVIRTRGRARQIPRAACSAARRWPPANTPWTADPTRTARSPNAAYSAGIADSPGAADPARTTNSSYTAYPAGTTDSSYAADATDSAWAAGSPWTEARSWTVCRIITASRRYVRIGYVDVIVVVDRSTPVFPIAVPIVVTFVDKRSHRHSEPKGQQPSRKHFRSSVTVWRLHGRSVGGRRIVLGHIHDIWLGWLDDHGLLLRRGLSATFGRSRRRRLRLDLLLRRALERPRLHRSVSKRLDRRHYVIWLVVIGFAKRRGPGQTIVHRLENLRKLGKRFDAGIPSLSIDLGSQLIRRELWVLL